MSLDDAWRQLTPAIEAEINVLDPSEEFKLVVEVRQAIGEAVDRWREKAWRRPRGKPRTSADGLNAEWS